jgi:tetratricopeptide (TPR) repeat protein
MRTGRLWLVLAALTACPASASAQAADPCKPTSDSATGWRPSDLRVLIARFNSADATQSSQNFAAALGAAVQGVLPSYLGSLIDADSRTAGMKADSVQARYIACSVSDHREARKLGERWNADLVIWGSAQSSLPQDTKQLAIDLKKQLKGLNVASNNTIIAPGAASIKVEATLNLKVVAPTAAATFQTSMTAVNWPGLESSGRGSRIASVLDQDFPHLATSSPLGLFHLVLGNYAYFKKQFATAAKFFIRAKDDAFVNADHQEALYWRVSDSLVKSGDANRALPFALRALETCPPHDTSCQALYSNNLGWVLEKAGKTSDAATAYASALKLSRSLADPYLEATALNNQAASILLDEPRRAIPLLELALPLRQQANDIEGEGSTLHNLGIAMSLIGRGDDALALLAEAIPKRQAVGDTAGEAATLRSLSELYSRKGRFDLALKYAEDARSLNQSIGNKQRALQIEQLIWTAAKRTGDNLVAQRSASRFEEILNKDPTLLTRTSDITSLNNAGKMLHDLGKYDRAIKLYKQALVLAKAADSVDTVILLHNNIGKSLFLQKRNAGALREYDQALLLMQQKPDATFADFVLHNVGLLEVALGRDKDAVEFFDRALKKRFNNPQRTREAPETLSALAAALGRLGNAEEGVVRYEQAASLYLLFAPPDIAAAKQSLIDASGLATKASRTDLIERVAAEQRQIETRESP